VKLLVGLGNPGDKYQATRHNVGFMVAEQLAQGNGIALKKKGYQAHYGVGRVAGQETTVLLPQTFMNRSGASVNAACQSLGITPGDLIVIHDDLDLPYGTLRVKLGGGHGGHNGLRDIIGVYGNRDFVRLRIGIGRSEQGNVTGHVLGRFSSEEQTLLPRLIDTAVEAAEKIISAGVNPAMNAFNNFDLYG